jgi:opacity protein-like surface antigen
MHCKTRLRLALCLAALATAGPLAAQEPAPAPSARSRWYGVGLAGTSLGYRPQGGPWDGWQHDLAANLGVGRFVGSKLAFELDLGATWVRGDYVNAALTPGVLYSFNANVYAAGRVIVPFDPEADVVLYPGLGVIHTFSNGLAPLVEVNLARSFDRRDLALTVTVGLLFNP